MSSQQQDSDVGSGWFGCNCCGKKWYAPKYYTNDRRYIQHRCIGNRNLKRVPDVEATGTSCPIGIPFHNCVVSIDGRDKCWDTDENRKARSEWIERYLRGETGQIFRESWTGGLSKQFDPWNFYSIIRAKAYTYDQLKENPNLAAKWH